MQSLPFKTFLMMCYHAFVIMPHHRIFTIAALSGALAGVALAVVRERSGHAIAEPGAIVLLFSVLYAVAGAIALRLPGGWGSGGNPAVCAVMRALIAGALPLLAILPLPAEWFRASTTNPFGAGRYLLTLSVVGSVFAYVATLGKELIQARVSPVRPVAALGLLLVGALTAIQAGNVPWDDESVRLMTVESLVRDGDIDVSNQRLSNAWRSFRLETISHFETENNQLVGGITRSKPGPLYTGTATGSDILAAIGYAIPAWLDAHPYFLRFGAALPMALAAALLPALLVRTLLFGGASRDHALLAAGVLATSPPYLFFTGRLWPEWPAALALLYSVSLASPNNEKSSTSRATALGLAIGSLALLHFRFAVPALAVAVVAITIRIRNSTYREAAILIGVLLLCATVASLDFVGRRYDSSSLAIMRESNYPFLLDRRAPQTFEGLLTVAIGYLIPPGGPLTYTPWIALTLPFLMLASIPSTGRFAALAAVVSLAVFLIGMRIPPSGPLGRYFVVLLPLLLLSLPRVLAAGPMIRAAFGACIAWSIFKATGVVIAPALAFDSKLAAQAAARLEGGETFTPLVGFLVRLLFA